MANYLYEKNEYKQDYYEVMFERFGKCCWSCRKSDCLEPEKSQGAANRDIAYCLKHEFFETEPHEYAEWIEDCWESN